MYPEGDIYVCPECGYEQDYRLFNPDQEIKGDLCQH